MILGLSAGQTPRISIIGENSVLEAPNFDLGTLTQRGNSCGRGLALAGGWGRVGWVHFGLIHYLEDPKQSQTLIRPRCDSVCVPITQGAPDGPALPMPLLPEAPRLAQGLWAVKFITWCLQGSTPPHYREMGRSGGSVQGGRPEN